MEEANSEQEQSTNNQLAEEELISEEPEENIDEDLPGDEQPIEPEQVKLTEEEKYLAVQASLNDASELLASDPVRGLSDTKALLLDADF